MDALAGISEVLLFIGIPVAVLSALGWSVHLQQKHKAKNNKKDK